MVAYYLAVSRTLDTLCPKRRSMLKFLSTDMYNLHFDPHPSSHFSLSHYTSLEPFRTTDTHEDRNVKQGYTHLDCPRRYTTSLAIVEMRHSCESFFNHQPPYKWYMTPSIHTDNSDSQFKNCNINSKIVHLYKFLGIELEI